VQSCLPHTGDPKWGDDRGRRVGNDHEYKPSCQTPVTLGSRLGW
jgi:hypothetical protein